MVLSRDEKERLVLDLYYNKGCTYRDIAKELKISPNQISDIIKKHEEKSNAIAIKRSSCLYPLKLTNYILKAKLRWK
jgi:transposase